MIWHIFKKDLRLFWPYILGVAALQFAHAGIVIRLGLFDEPQTLARLWSTGGAIVSVAVAILIVLVVQQDALHGTRQDWLARPVKRRDLLVAKLLFVAAAIYLPVFAAETLIGLTHGLPAGAALGAALAASIGQFVAFGLPLLMLAALTGTTLEALIGVLLLLVTTYALYFLTLGTPELFSGGGGVLWMQTALKYLLILAGAAIILPLQYFRRQTRILRGVFVVGVLLAAAVSQLPQATAFAIEDSLSPDPQFGGAVSVAFDPALGRFRSGGSESSPSDPLIYLPLRVAGLPRGSMLDADRFVITLTGADGTVLFHDSPRRFMPDDTNHDGDPGLRLRLADSDNGTARLHQSFRVPAALLARIKTQPVRVQIDYALTILKPAVTAVLTPAGDRKNVPGLGLCAARRDVSFFQDTTDDFTVHCFRTADTPDCMTIFARDTKSGLSDPIQEYCYSMNYEPKFLKMAALGGPGAQVATYRFWRARKDEPYPVGIDRIAHIEFVIAGYAPQAHIARRVVTPPIKLADWTIVIVPHLPRNILK